MPPYQRQQPTQITRNLNLIDAKPHADEFLCQMQPQIRDAATTLMRRGAAKGRPAPPARFWPGRSCRWRSYSSKSASIPLNIDQNRGAVNPVRYLPHLSWCARTLRLSSLPSVAQRLERLSVQRLKSPLEGFSPGVHLRGRCYGDRTGGRPARSVLSGAVATACLSYKATTQAAWRSAIEIASGKLFAGRPPAWTLPRRPHRRSPGAKRPLRRGLWRLKIKSAILR